MSETDLTQFREVVAEGRFTRLNSSLLKVRLEGDEVRAELGSMVAYQGDVRFEHKGGGVGRFFRRAVTGEGVELMSACGTGDLFLDLAGDRMTVNGDNVLAFEPGID